MFLTKNWMIEQDEKAEKWSLTISKMTGAEKRKVVLDHVSNNNKKLGKNCQVFNTGTAHKCPSIALGYCQAGKACYAQRDERQYKSSYPYRSRQSRLWKYVSPQLFASALLQQKNRARSNKMESFRYSESGDFSSQEHVNWMSEVCAILTAAGIVCFGYTARADLNVYPLTISSQVNVSNDKFKALDINRFKMVLELQENVETCLCSTDENSTCADCQLCKKLTGKIQILKH